MEFPTASDRVLLLSPHPDDDILAAGGLLQQISLHKTPVRIVFATDGDNNPWPQRFIERRWRINAADRRRWGLMRRCEALAALSTLGINDKHIVFFGLPDQGLTKLLLQRDQSVVKRILAEITSWNPTIIIAPAPFDLHPDHSALAIMLKLALQPFVVARKPPIKVLHFAIHQKQLAFGKKLSISLTSQQISVKRSALLQHESQLRLSRKRFLRYVNEQEDFYLGSLPGLKDKAHAFKAGFAESGYLNLVMNKPGVADCLLGISYYIASGVNPGNFVVLRLGVLPLGRATISDSSGTVRYSSGVAFTIRDSLIVRFPGAILGSPREIYVKQKTKWGFLDAGGWQSLSILDASPTGELPYVETVALIPCYNVAALCAEVIRKTLGAADCVIVIDDGSTDGTGQILTGLQAEYGARLRVISKNVNEGKGSALLSGMQYAMEQFQFTALITLDADGQHRPEDISKATRTILQGRDFVIGQRNFSTMPLRSRLGNTVTKWVFHKLYPNCPSDTQSGFRAFSSRFVREIVKFIRHGRYETELYTLLLALSLGVEIGIFEIDTIYIDENRSSHFRPLVDSFRILFSLLRWQLHTLC